MSKQSFKYISIRFCLVSQRLAQREHARVFCKIRSFCPAWPLRLFSSRRWRCARRFWCGPCARMLTATKAPKRRHWRKRSRRVVRDRQGSDVFEARSVWRPVWEIDNDSCCLGGQFFFWPTRKPMDRQPLGSTWFLIGIAIAYESCC